MLFDAFPIFPKLFFTHTVYTPFSVTLNFAVYLLAGSVISTQLSEVGTTSSPTVTAYETIFELLSCAITVTSAVPCL